MHRLGSFKKVAPPTNDSGNWAGTTSDEESGDGDEKAETETGNGDLETTDGKTDVASGKTEGESGELNAGHTLKREGEFVEEKPSVDGVPHALNEGKNGVLDALKDVAPVEDKPDAEDVSTVRVVKPEHSSPKALTHAEEDALDMPGSFNVHSSYDHDEGDGDPGEGLLARVRRMRFGFGT